MRQFTWVAWSIVAGIVGIVHLLFAIANFSLGGLAIAEGIFSALAGAALTASIFLFRASRLQAVLVVLGGSLPLTLWFTVTVPEHSDWSLLYISLIVPGTAIVLATMIYVSRRLRTQK